MEFPPTDWAVFEAADFEVAQPRNPGDLGVELLAQVRPNGRVVDHWRLTMGGAKILEVTMPLSSIVPKAAEMPAVKLRFQKWPAEIYMRRNMTTTDWLDVLELLAANDVTVASETGEPVENQVVVEALNNIVDKGANSASLRWAIAISPANKLELQLQCLPVPTHRLSRPIFKR